MYPLIASSHYATCPIVDVNGGVKFDPRYKFISSIDEEHLFTTNGIHSLISRLPYIEEYYYYNYKWNLYSNNYYPFKLDCETSGVSRDEFYTAMDATYVVGSKISAFQAFTWVLLVFTSCDFIWVPLKLKFLQSGRQAASPCMIITFVFVSLGSLIFIGLILGWSFKLVSAI